MAAAPPQSRRAAILAILLAALVLRLGFALRKGLVLDEFHSLFHARNAIGGNFFDSLLEDNHPPLSFLLIGGARAIFGEAEIALRSPALLFGLAEIALVFAIARRVLGPARALFAAALLASSSLHLDFSTQARMYALHGLAATTALLGWIELALRPREARGFGPHALVAGGILVGLHNHYFTAQYAAGIGIAFLLLAARRPELRARARELVIPAVIAITLALPWFLTGFRAQFAHALPPGGDDQGLAGLAEAFVHLFFLNVRIGGDALRLVFITAGGFALALAGLGCLRLARGHGRRSVAWLLTIAAFGVPAGAALLAAALPRAGFTWHYVLPSAAPMAILVAASLGPGRFSGLRSLAACAVIAAALTLSILNVMSRGTEDYPGAVAHLLDEWREGDAIVSVEWQPALFPQGQPWDYYAPRSTDTPPARLAMRGFTVADRPALVTAERVLLLRSKLPPEQPLMRWIFADFEEISSTSYGYGRFAQVFAKR